MLYRIDSESVLLLMIELQKMRCDLQQGESSLIETTPLNNNKQLIGVFVIIRSQPITGCVKCESSFGTL